MNIRKEKAMSKSVRYSAKPVVPKESAQSQQKLAQGYEFLEYLIKIRNDEDTPMNNLQLYMVGNSAATKILASLAKLVVPNKAILAAATLCHLYRTYQPWFHITEFKKVIEDIHKYKKERAPAWFSEILESDLYIQAQEDLIRRNSKLVKKVSPSLALKATKDCLVAEVHANGALRKRDFAMKMFKENKPEMALQAISHWKHLMNQNERNTAYSKFINSHFGSQHGPILTEYENWVKNFNFTVESAKVLCPERAGKAMRHLFLQQTVSPVYFPTYEAGVPLAGSQDDAEYAFWKQFGLDKKIKIEHQDCVLKDFVLAAAANGDVSFRVFMAVMLIQLRNGLPHVGSDCQDEITGKFFDFVHVILNDKNLLAFADVFVAIKDSVVMFENTISEPLASAQPLRPYQFLHMSDIDPIRMQSKILTTIRMFTQAPINRGALLHALHYYDCFYANTLTDSFVQDISSFVVCSTGLFSPHSIQVFFRRHFTALGWIGHEDPAEGNNMVGLFVAAFVPGFAHYPPGSYQKTISEAILLFQDELIPNNGREELEHGFTNSVSEVSEEEENPNDVIAMGAHSSDELP